MFDFVASSLEMSIVSLSDISYIIFQMKYLGGGGKSSRLKMEVDIIFCIIFKLYII